uniref:Uncharacterized protein n=1 Tax=Arundo donax TaxID=35708 RepID=A0A0A9VG33_ARUDO
MGTCRCGRRGKASRRWQGRGCRRRCRISRGRPRGHLRQVPLPTQASGRRRQGAQETHALLPAIPPQSIQFQARGLEK